VRHLSGLRGAFIVATSIGFFALGCGRDSTSPAPDVLRDLPGEWVAPFSIPGSGEGWTLSLSGNTITGDGTWRGEACCNGTVSITGELRGDSVHLDLVYRVSPPRTAPPPRMVHIDAVLDTPTDLIGTARGDDGATGPAHYIKPKP
jgi:hypothetical protein